MKSSTICRNSRNNKSSRIEARNQGSTLYAQRYTYAAAFLLGWAILTNKCNTLHSQCKAYLSAITVYLYRHYYKQTKKFSRCDSSTGQLYEDRAKAVVLSVDACIDGQLLKGQQATMNLLIRLKQRISVSCFDLLHFCYSCAAVSMVSGACPSRLLQDVNSYYTNHTDKFRGYIFPSCKS
ncbi:gamma-soluble NSF attachment protein [Artemisia annua]|uniref:Gamma-soluble NSF attachment protein n=1 Tax=Artemisia annua TaxID=35608 RepID=A0A2U1LJT9_ARTAN|nr:gamma-soluble NSF attachment protein [Artemisia annua]